MTFMWIAILSIIGGVTIAAVILARAGRDDDAFDLDALEGELSDEVDELNKN